MNITPPRIKSERQMRSSVLRKMIARSGIKKCAIERQMGISRGYLSQLTGAYRPVTERRIHQAQAAIEMLKSP